MNKAPHPLGRLFTRAFALTCALAALGSFASGAPAAGSGPYSLEVEALLSASGTDLALRVGGPDLPQHLEMVQVKSWRVDGNGVVTRNFFDVPAPNGLATLALDGPNRGDRLEVSAHLKNGQQYNLEAESIVLRRPDLTVEAIDIPDDVVRTRPFDVTVTVEETGATPALTHSSRSSTARIRRRWRPRQSKLLRTEQARSRCGLCSQSRGITGSAPW